MQGADLKRLARVATLSKVDYANFPLHLIASGDSVVAKYAGTYSVGRLELLCPGNFDIYVDPHHFAEHARMFENQTEVQVSKTTGGQLRLRSADIELALQPVNPDDRGIELAEDATASGIELQSDDLLEEIKLASEFTARSFSNRVLTGLRLVTQNDGVVIEAMDGFSCSYTSKIPLGFPPDDPIDVVIPAYDFVLGVEMTQIAGSSVKLYKPTIEAPDGKRSQNRIGIETSIGNFQCALLSGEWPDFSSLHNLDYADATKLLVDTEKLKIAVQSSGIFQARWITLRPAQGKTILHVNEDSGQMAIALDGPAVSSNRRLRIDSITNMSKLGAIVELSVPLDEGSPIKALSGLRTMWLNPLVQ